MLSRYTRACVKNAKAKERILSEQSIFLLDHIEEMENDLKTLDSEIATLLAQNRSVKKSLKPLF